MMAYLMRVARANCKRLNSLYKAGQQGDKTPLNETPKETQYGQLKKYLRSCI